MEDVSKKLKEEKSEFIKALENTLLLDKRSGVKKIEYYSDDNIEYVCIEYQNGHKDYINTTCNSNGANAKEIIAQVYGDGAFGYSPNRNY